MDMQTNEYARPKQIYEQVAEQIRAEIRTGRFALASKLPSERELATLFKVGRPAVREAIGALQNEGLVTTKRGSGTYVSTTAEQLQSTNIADDSLEAHSASDISPVGTLNVRLILEPAIAKLAAKHGKRDKLAEQYLDSMSAVKDINDPQQQRLWTTCDRLFHRQLAVMTGDPLILHIADEVAKAMDQPLWQRLRDDGIYDSERIKLYVAEHRLIYEAIITRDETSAAFYVEQHIRRVRRDIAPK